MKLLLVLIPLLLLSACGDAERKGPRTDRVEPEPALSTRELERELDEIEREIAPDAGH
jgi:hypothetical protein